MKAIRKVLKGVSLTAAMFVFQACYGTPEDDWYVRENLTFRVVSALDGKPLEGVQVETQLLDSDSVARSAWSTRAFTDSQGLASVYAVLDEYTFSRFRFTADDASYAVKDTIIRQLDCDTVDIVLYRAD